MNVHLMTSSLLFLDIDGVMNTTESCLRNRSGLVFTREAVAALREIVRVCDCRIVISSTRRSAGLAALRTTFIRNDLAEVAARIIGITPAMVEHDTDDWREDEIAAWLDGHAYKGKLAICDDKPFSGPMRRFLILTDQEIGLTPALARRVAALLQG